MDELKYLTEQINNEFYGKDIRGVKLYYKDKKQTFEIEYININSQDYLYKINYDLKKYF